MEFEHTSVLLKETVDALNVHSGIYVDGTLGGGGHSEEILRRCAEASVIGIDRDDDALKAAAQRLYGFGGRASFVKGNFADVKNILVGQGIGKIDGAVLDLGVSSYQLDNKDRGFSYMQDAPLDMRMDRDGGKSAYDIVNSYTKNELADIFFKYGEEKWSKRIAEFIEERRKEKPVETTGELVDIIKAAVPQGARMTGGHPAKRVFQAIRIEVNGELEILDKALNDFADSLKSGGRLCVITFHSLEDRIVKNVFNRLRTGCVCPKDFPVCVCGKVPEARLPFKKPVLPSNAEMEINTRAKSAKLRVLEKI